LRPVARYDVGTMSRLTEHRLAPLLFVAGALLVSYLLSDGFRDEAFCRLFGPSEVSDISDLRCDNADGRITGLVHLTEPEHAVIRIGLYTGLEGIWARVDATDVEFPISKEEVELPESLARPMGGIKVLTFKTDGAEFELYSPAIGKARDYEIRVESSSTGRVAVAPRG
jgi:hypothetical protein